MSDLIDRQAAITQLSHNKNKGDDEWELAVESDIQTIWKLPSAQHEIILCKDCIYKSICSFKRKGMEYCSFAEK